MTRLRIGRVLASVCLCTTIAAMRPVTAQQAAVSSSPAYDAEGRLLFPQEYRSWPNLGTGLGMAYGPIRDESSAHPPFTNVFVNPEAYREFLKTARWPDRTLFVLEIRRSIPLNNSSTGSNGRYQGDILGIEAEVKDLERFAGGWAFFNLQTDEPAGTQIPLHASCYSCHAKHAAVENTFVQFYPVLRDIAKERGTLKPVAEAF